MFSVVDGSMLLQTDWQVALTTGHWLSHMFLYSLILARYGGTLGDPTLHHGAAPITWAALGSFWHEIAFLRIVVTGVVGVMVLSWTIAVLLARAGVHSVRGQHLAATQPPRVAGPPASKQPECAG